MVAAKLMPTASSFVPRAGDVRTKLTYALQPAGGAEAYFINGAQEASTNVVHEDYDTLVRDIRNFAPECTLAGAGFQLTSLSSPELEWTDEAQVKQKFYPVAEQVIKRATGASRVFIFDHTLRQGIAKHDDKQLCDPKAMGDPKKRPPIPRIHTDFSEKSGPQRLKATLPDEAEKLSQSRYAIIQLWRPLVGPVTESPLAVIDVRSLSPEDMMELRMEVPASDPRARVLGTASYIYIPKYNKNHRPYYVHTVLTYPLPAPEGSTLYYSSAKGVANPSTNVSHKDYEVVVRDMRSAPESLTLAEAGFQLDSLTAPEIPWTDEAEIREKFYPVAEEVIKRATGASRVLPFDYVVRKGFAKHSLAELKDPKAMAQKIRQPNPRVHTDFTEKSGPMRLHQILPDEADKLSKARYAIIQLWRPLVGPVTESPFALIDARSVEPDDLQELRLEMQSDDPRTNSIGVVSYIYAPKHNQNHRPYYVSNMTTEEVLLFKGFDTRTDLPRFVPHAGFRLPDTADGLPPRESIELRALAFWDEE
ncbi:hypothetical protein WJX73_008740 [Symbiochloris irregularis]|uniref:Uncharacterized protein n=1 Tax=Symbiochloris irregularis TaxID=706552 RepID=A0AAW1NGQ9_9CHLO